MNAGERAHQAAAVVARSVLRWSGGRSSGLDPDTETAPVFGGVRECGEHLARLTGAPVATARAFGGEWPVVSGEGWCVAPALPMALVGPGGDGIDGAYTVRGGSVWREAAGEELLFLSDSSATSPGERFDLLWFGDAERYTVQRGSLRIEDLFVRVDVAADLGVLERILVRGRRVKRDVLEGLTLEPSKAPARITTSRAAALVSEDRWRDPVRFLDARADIDRAVRRGERIEAESRRGPAIRFLLEDRADGWTLRAEGDDYPLQSMSLRRRQASLTLVAELHPAVDPLAPGMRGRLAFDLRSDLVALG